MNAENEDDFLHRLAIKVRTQICYIRERPR